MVGEGLDGGGRGYVSSLMCSGGGMSVVILLLGWSSWRGVED